MEENELEEMLQEISSCDYQNAITNIERVHGNIDESDYDEDIKDEIREYFGNKIKEVL